MLKVGKSQNGTGIYISEKSPNRHISVLGISGSGKTIRLRELINNVVANEETALIFDINGMDYKNCADKIRFVSAREDGLHLELLDAGIGEAEKISHIMSIVRVLCRTFRLGSKQEEILRNALLYAIDHREEMKSDLSAIRAGLQEQDTPAAKAVESRLWEFFKMDVVRRASSKLETGCANVISLEGLSPGLQSVWVEQMLTLLWRKLRTRVLTVKNLWIFIDEFQNLSLKKDSVLLEMLCEARKYGTNLVLATQSVAEYEKDILSAIDQTAVHLFFRQGLTDMKKVASLIDVNKKGHWETKLKALRVGESIAVGCFSMNGRTIENPIIISSEFNDYRQ